MNENTALIRNDTTVLGVSKKTVKIFPITKKWRKT